MENKFKKKALVIHSGGMDSSICLALAIKKYSKENVLSLSFTYDQRHSTELEQAQKICKTWEVDHAVLDISCLKEITTNALTNRSIEIKHETGSPPNTLVVGRNGLMAYIGGIHAHQLGASCIYLGVLGLEGNHSGYRDCSRAYMDLVQALLRMDLNDQSFIIETPLVEMNKKETLLLAKELGILEYLLEETVTCYEGIQKQGCKVCPSCLLRNEGIRQYQLDYPSLTLSYSL